MRFFVLLAFLASLWTLVAAWDKEDHEIFDLVTAIEAAEGKGTSFYSWLEVPPTASTSEISKAYRKKSIQLHPDKNPGVKGAHDRFARLGVVVNILRNPEKRKRYDFFYKNGVPKWRGTGYYYSRFRPGVGSVLVFLTLLSSVLQYVIQRLNYRRDLDRIKTIREQAKTAAWGNMLSPPTGPKKVKVNLGGATRVDEDGNVYGGRMIDMVVEGNNVSILEPDGNLIPVDESTATPPSWKRTWFLALVSDLVAKAAKRGSSEGSDREDGEIDESEEGSVASSDVPGSGTVTPSEKAGATLKTGRMATSMAGGRRRKVVRKR
ncbi:DnaJ-domain-containing protein [Panus rudis PR-1116 ss-1]|nr:DnaJ-domain-containing protein [Panus rudis PR-1116 ss-1]